MKRKVAYVPERGDAVWISLDPQAGHEQAGRRPALVLSPAAYNGRVGLALLCPITNQAKGYPFEVPLPEGLPVTGVVGADQVKSLDWRAQGFPARRRPGGACCGSGEASANIAQARWLTSRCSPSICSCSPGRGSHQFRGHRTEFPFELYMVSPELLSPELWVS